MLRRLARALLRRCPNCGGGSIFDGWFTLREECASCHLHYEREEGYWLGAIAINTGLVILAFAVTFTVSTVLTWPNPPWTLIGAATVAVSLVGPIVFYPLSKTIWVAVDLGLQGGGDGRMARGE